MKFQVREGFVIHDQRIVEINGKPTEQTNSYYEGQTVDFDEDTARAHLHKLEPQDRAAREYAATRYAVVAPPPSAAIDPAVLAQLIAQGVAAAMVMQSSVQGTPTQTQAPASNG
jgi:hypothetical protein